MHEQPTPELPGRATGLLVGHDGYTPAANARKDGRNRDLIEAAIQDDPADAYLWYQLGNDHAVQHRWEQALPCLVTAYNLTHPEGRQSSAGPRPLWWHRLVLRLILTLIATDRWEDAVALGEQESDAWSDSADFFYVFGLAAFGLAHAVLAPNGRPADSLVTAALDCWTHAVELGDKQQYAGTLMGRATTLSAERLAEAYRIVGRDDDPARYEAVANGESRAMLVPPA